MTDAWWQSANDWRWDARSDPARVPNVTVYEMGADALAERKRKIDQGAQIVPFGFGRAIVPSPGTEDKADHEPLLWEGSD